MLKRAQGEVSPKLWSTGITAALLNYQILGRRYQVRNHGNTQTTYSMNMMLQGGVNISAWQLRYRVNNSYDKNKSNWQMLETYVARDIPDWKSRLTLGDSFTPSDIFPGMRFRGMQLASDDAMLPDSLRGYAPSVHGIAQSQAKVTIKQNGYIIYTTFVAPGPFVIDDLLPNTLSGTLEITVTEADGRSIVSYQTYSAFPGQLREKNKRFYFAAGAYRAEVSKVRSNFMQGTLLYGLNAHVTGYGGLLASSFYRSVLAGASANLKQYGSSSIDITQTDSQQNEGVLQRGQALRWQYAKNHLSTKTHFQIAVQRYFNADFCTFAEAADSNYFSNRQINKRSRFESTLSQHLGRGIVNLSVEKVYYRHGQAGATVRFGYGGQIKKVSYHLDYSYQKAHGILNRQLSLSLTFPFKWEENSSAATSINYAVSSYFNRDIVHNVTTGGLLLEDDSLSYSVGLSASRQIRQSSFASLNFRGPVAEIGIHHTQALDYMVSSATLSGGVVLHQDGITLSQRLGDTVILVRVPGAHNAAFENNMSIKINTQGYAVIPYATPYRRNLLTLNTEQVSDDIDIKNTTTEVVPTRGAIVLAEYEVRQGHKVLLTVLGDSGQPLPFGARVEDQRGREVGMIGPEGQVYLTGVKKDDLFTIKWGMDNKDRCTLQYNVQKASTTLPLAHFSIERVACLSSITDNKE